MNYKKVFVFIFLILIGVPLFASGVVESGFSGMGTGAMAGMSIGGTAGLGIGALPGALLGGALGFFGGVGVGLAKQPEEDKQKGISYEDKYLEAKASSESYQSLIEQNKTALTSSERRVSVYDEFLANYGDTKTQQENSLMQKGNAQQDQLMSNFSNLQTVMGATGSTGASSAISADIGKQGVEQFAGTDLTLNKTGGGTFAKIWEDTERELSDKYSSSSLSKQDLFSVMENYRASIGRNTASKKTQVARANEFKEEANKYGRKIN